MARTCPNCGHELPRSSRIGTEILDELLQTLGGARKIGARLAEKLQGGTEHQQMTYYGRLLTLVESEDKATARQQEIDMMTTSQERAIMLEHTLYLIENDPTFLPQAIEIRERKVLDTQ